MEVRAVAKHIRISPHKLRPIVSLIRNKRVDEAVNLLRVCPKANKAFVLTVLNSAIANAKENSDVADPDELVVSQAFVDEGRTLKRFIPRARGRATSIRKRSAHITIILSEQEK